VSAVGPRPRRERRTRALVRTADLHSRADAEALVRLLDEYATDPMGRGQALSAVARERIVPGLLQIPTAIVYLVAIEGKVSGVAVCFLKYSTFGAFPLMNIHDFMVTASARGRGIGRTLLDAICRDAKSRGCGRVTLEVREDNIVAQQLYRSEGFGELAPCMLFWQRLL